MKDLFLLDQSSEEFPVDGEHNDIAIENHNIKMVESRERKIQDVVKALLTRKGANFVYPAYGSVLSSTVGQRRGPSFNDDVSDSLKETFGYLQQIEPSANRDERIRRVVTVELRDTTDPRALDIVIVLELEDGTQIRQSVSL